MSGRRAAMFREVSSCSPLLFGAMRSFGLPGAVGLRVVRTAEMRPDKSGMVRPERFELPTCCSGGNRSIQLSYGRSEFSLHGREKRGNGRANAGETLRFALEL